MDKDARKELVEYYKWMVSIAIFVMTISISAAALLTKGLVLKWLFVLGWFMLASCIFFNWLLIKRLITIPIVNSVPERDKTKMHYIFESTMVNMKWYGLIQNLTFLLGSIMLVAAFIVNIWRK